MARGDHVRVRRGVYWHHGIDCGDGMIVHYDGSPRRRNGAVSLASHDGFGRGRRIEVVHPCDPEEAENIVARAESRVGESRYDLVWNNCEHFARWCVTGQSSSRQVERVIKGIATAVALAGIAVGLWQGRRTRSNLPGA